MSTDSNSSTSSASAGKKSRVPGCDNPADIQTIHKMLQGQQYAAALNFINTVLEKNPNQPDILDVKCHLLYIKCFKEMNGNNADSITAWHEAVGQFISLFPEHPLALAWESLVCTNNGELDVAYDYLEKCFINHYPEMSPSGMLSALSSLSQEELNAGLIPAALFLLSLRATFFAQLEAAQEYEQTHRLQLRILSDSSLALPLRQTYSFYQTNSRGALTAEFTAAQQLISTFHWLEGAQAFEKIAVNDPTELNCAYNAAILYLNRSKIADASRLFKMYSDREPELNRKIDALATALLLSKSPLEDNMLLYDFQYKVTDQDRLRELLLSSNRLISQNVPADNFDGPPPLFIGSLLDQPKQTLWSESLTFEDIPLILGSVALWGKRTDREAILEFSSILECDKEDVYEFVKESFGDCVEGDPQAVTMEAPSVTIDSFTRPQAFPDNTPQDKINQLQKEHFNDLLLNWWPDFNLGVLGTTLREAAADEQKQPLVRAVIQVVEYLLGVGNPLLDFDALYNALNLKPLPPLKIESGDLATLPPSLYGAIDLKSLSDNDLAALYARYNPYGSDSVMHKLATEIVSRNTLSVDIRKTAYIKLCLSVNGIIPENIPQGKDFCKANNISDSYFDMMELQSMLMTGNMAELEKKMHEIYQDHKDEPQTMQALMNFVQQIQQLSAMIARGQNPTDLPTQGASTTEPQQTSSSGLWTPDSPNPPASPAQPEKKSSIWLPD
ncbi:MAG: hypothetical protein IJQ39_09850 [Thermoguttaceae bacterium]|nr:hypothetical protein [Thermoguttaceae bacterium]